MTNVILSAILVVAMLTKLKTCTDKPAAFIALLFCIVLFTAALAAAKKDRQ